MVVQPGRREVAVTELVLVVAMLAAVSMQLGTCAGPGVGAAEGKPEESALTLGWAATDYTLHEPEGAAVLLEVVVRNRTDDVTQSTSIQWEPDFGLAFTFLESDPPAWRVRVDEEGGWGVLDTNGVLAREDGAFRLWFGIAGGADAELADRGPRIKVVADGNRVVGEGVARPVHAQERARLLDQQAFERGGPAALADHVPFVPVTSGGAFVAGMGLAVTLLGVAGMGVAAAMRVTLRGSPGRQFGEARCVEVGVEGGVLG